jgi:hypothetical protein
MTCGIRPPTEWPGTRKCRKARMDQRTRERLPVLRALVRAAASEREAAAARLAACTAARPGKAFTAGGQALRRAVLAKGETART